MVDYNIIFPAPGLLRIIIVIYMQSSRFLNVYCSYNILRFIYLQIKINLWIIISKWPLQFRIENNDKVLWGGVGMGDE